ncbi:MAG: tetratricopeptide repeat protein [Pontiellaceae bacterium]|nr:tetratricopeptide repeat protein [Pontiellaceae bacterium]MBN2785835.1 tetratricopeptide repeat protein [Pontiellaceae bacterium]
MNNYIPVLLLASSAVFMPSARAIEFTEQGEYLGSSQCLSCHERFYELWSTSHHGKAMQAFSAAFARTLEPMDEPMMIGTDRFRIELNGAGGVLVQTDASGESRSYPVLHALGGKNVYFFLVPLEKGKLQVAPLAYNVHTKSWYDSTGSMVRHFRDGSADEALDWTDRLLTFNAACHDCHVSQLRKNYNPSTDSYMTTWNEAGINCEVCHGPGEEHVKAAEEAKARNEELVDMRITRFRGDLNPLQRDSTCAPCHAKMSPVSHDFVPGELFFDHYDLSGYEDPDFFPDGRDLGENYTQTGWLANPCARSGQLECIHCHTSSGRFRFADNPNQACLPCHQSRVDHILDHSHHKAEANVTCVSCHMPMTAHAHMHRSDHSFRPPSPAASLEFGSPNACNLCHNNREAIAGEFTGHATNDILWAKEHVEQWHGIGSGRFLIDQGRIVAICRAGDWDHLDEVLAFIDKADQPSKVGILRMLENCPDPAKWPAIRNQLADDSEWVRSAAAAALHYDLSPEATGLLLKAAADQFRIVRIRAAASLLGRDPAGYSDEERQVFNAANEEYWNSLLIWPDRWSTHYNQGIYFEQQGESSKALEAYGVAMELRDNVIQPMINASMIYARAGDTTNAYTLLQRALVVEPESPMANFNIALVEAEFGNLEACEQHLRTALKADPGMAPAAFNLGVLLCQDKRIEGLEWLRSAAVLAPDNWDYASSALYFINQQSRASDAESLLKAVIDTGRAAPEAYFALAGNYQREGRKAEARDVYRKARQSRHLPMNAKRYAAQMDTSLQDN